MRTEQVLKNLRKALQQDYLYNGDELKFMKKQLKVLVQEIQSRKPQGFGK